MGDQPAYFWEGRKVRLRAMLREDLPIWLAACEDSETERTLGPGIELPKTQAEADAFFERFGEFRNPQDRIMFTIETLDRVNVGALNINSIDYRNGTFSIGSRLMREYRGLGYFEEAKRIVLRYCFHELRLQKYNSCCIEFNDAMVRHFARIGALPEGRRRRVNFTSGRFFDDLLYGLTREEFDANDAEWPERREP